MLAKDLIDQVDGLSLSGSQLTSIAAWIGTGVGGLGAFLSALTWWFVQKHLPSIAEERRKDAAECKSERMELTKLFVDRDDRRAQEQMAWRSVMVEEWAKSRTEMRGMVDTIKTQLTGAEDQIVGRLDDAREALRNEIGAKLHGYARPGPVVGILFAGILTIAAVRCSHDDRSPAQRRFDYACDHYEAHQ